MTAHTKNIIDTYLLHLPSHENKCTTYTNLQHKNSSYTTLVSAKQFFSLRISVEVPISSVCLCAQQHPDIQPVPVVLANLDKNLL